MDFTGTLKTGNIFSEKVQDCRFQVRRYTFKPAQLESYQQVTHGHLRVKNAEHSL